MKIRPAQADRGVRCLEIRTVEGPSRCVVKPAQFLDAGSAGCPPQGRSSRLFVVGCVARIAAENSRLTNPLQPASDRLREGSERSPCVGLRHAHNMPETPWKNLRDRTAEQFAENVT